MSERLKAAESNLAAAGSGGAEALAKIAQGNEEAEFRMAMEQMKQERDQAMAAAKKANDRLDEIMKMRAEAAMNKVRSNSVAGGAGGDAIGGGDGSASCTVQ